MAEILHFEILRKHGQTHKHTNTQTNKQTNRHGHYNTSPSPYGGRGNNLYNIFNEKLDALNQWCYANKLCLNVKKTKYILFRPSACFPNITNKHLYIDNNPISRVGDTEQEKSFKFLGIYMDETLTWKSHIGQICSKISHSNYIINKVKHILPTSSLHTLYLTIVQSHLNYGPHLYIYGGVVILLVKSLCPKRNPCG